MSVTTPPIKDKITQHRTQHGFDGERIIVGLVTENMMTVKLLNELCQSLASDLLANALWQHSIIMEVATVA